ncbi:Serine dehydratase-like protein [Grifola frondosa]|uniref:L-serine ammonia-lyase n=1 Tax=Grifola frondosa TaxID=5627 RepID=A0A1C7MFJ0_GRIFR|nr:Serine dehydratase-like protein [Grifola frondosa]
MSIDPFAGKLWLETPLIHSPHISTVLGCNAYLKLEVSLLQPTPPRIPDSDSHPTTEPPTLPVLQVPRHLAFRAAHPPHTRPQRAPRHRVGGNAGLAAACAARVLRLRCTVFLPEGVNEDVILFMQKEGAEVIIHGQCYIQALKRAETAVKEEPNAVMVPAYDHPVLWEGHSSMIHEIARQLPVGARPTAIFCSVGGGGLAGGIMQGCKAVGWDDVSFVTLETHGSNCFYQSLEQNPGPFPEGPSPPQEGVQIERDSDHGVAVAHLPKLTSLATSLGASSPAAGIPDELAIQAALFLRDHKMIVELACAATLAAAYRPILFEKLVPPSPTGARRTAVFIVCGGFKITLREMEEYRRIIEADMWRGGNWKVLCNGAQWDTPK